MPRVLVLTNRLPYPIDDGWKLRTYHVIRAMAQGADVTVATFHDGGEDEILAFRDSLPRSVEVVAVPPPKRNSPLRLLLGLLTPIPIYVWNERSGEMRRAVKRLIRERDFDAGVAELAHLYPYLRELPRDAKRVIDTHNIDSIVLDRYAANLAPGPRRFYARLTARKLARHEDKSFRDADLVWVCSDPEAAVLAKRVPRARVDVIPNGVDALGTEPARQRDVSGEKIVYCGHMGYYPNVDAIDYFVDEIMPLIHRARPDAEFWVVGRDPAPSVVEQGEKHPWVHVTGRVESVEPFIKDASVVAVPLRVGGGTRLKILEALALGKAVVSTTVGAEGLSLETGEHLMLADDPSEFADHVVRLMNDVELAERLGLQGRDRIGRLYDWTTIGERIRRAAGLVTATT